MKLLCIFALIVLFSQIFACVLAERSNDDVSSSSVDEAQNQVIEELKKQNEDMKAMMEELSLKLLRQQETFEEKFVEQEQDLAQQKQTLAHQEQDLAQQKQKLAHQEQKLTQQEEEIASLKSAMTKILNDIQDTTENAVVAENGKKAISKSRVKMT